MYGTPGLVLLACAKRRAKLPGLPSTPSHSSPVAKHRSMGRKRHSILRRELGNSRGMERLEHVDHSYMQANLHMQFRRHIAARTSLLLLLHCERDRRRRGGGGGETFASMCCNAAPALCLHLSTDAGQHMKRGESTTTEEMGSAPDFIPAFQYVSVLIRPLIHTLLAFDCLQPGIVSQWSPPPLLAL